MVLSKLREIFNKMGIYDEVSDSTMLCEDLFMDSTEITNLRCCIMGELGVDLTCEELTNNPLGEIIQTIEKNNKCRESDKND